jgi:hypothetical protein
MDDCRSAGDICDSGNASRLADWPSMVFETKAQTVASGTAGRDEQRPEKSGLDSGSVVAILGAP